MGKFEVKKVMRDKFTRVIFGPGEIRELTQERADEINKTLPGALEPYHDELTLEMDGAEIADVAVKETPKRATKPKTE